VLRFHYEISVGIHVDVEMMLLLDEFALWLCIDYEVIGLWIIITSKLLSEEKKLGEVQFGWVKSPTILSELLLFSPRLYRKLYWFLRKKGWRMKNEVMSALQQMVCETTRQRPNDTTLQRETSFHRQCLSLPQLYVIRVS
jgi:hypothetical protein